MTDPSEVQQGNSQWWSKNPMAYDWREDLGAAEGTEEFYAEVDRRFFASSPFYRGPTPFSRLMPPDGLAGKKVLEIGCGLGSHAQLLIEGGADYTGIDLTDRAVALTTQRLAVRGLRGSVTQMDAEHLAFDDDSFDLVWSWGVIHHSSDTPAIVRQILRVLRPGGETRLMVYNARSITGAAYAVRGTVAGKGRQGMSPRDMMSEYSDGFVAEHFTKAEFAHLLRQSGFENVNMYALGQKIELLPIPGAGPLSTVKQAAIKVVPDRAAELVLSRYGWFLFAAAHKPAAEART